MGPVEFDATADRQCYSPYGETEPHAVKAGTRGAYVTDGARYVGPKAWCRDCLVRGRAEGLTILDAEGEESQVPEPSGAPLCPGTGPCTKGPGGTGWTNQAGRGEPSRYVCSACGLPGAILGDVNAAEAIASRLNGSAVTVVPPVHTVEVPEPTEILETPTVPEPAPVAAPAEPEKSRKRVGRPPAALVVEKDGPGAWNVVHRASATVLVDLVKLKGDATDLIKIMGEWPVDWTAETLPDGGPLWDVLANEQHRLTGSRRYQEEVTRDGLAALGAPAGGPGGEPTRGDAPGSALPGPAGGGEGGEGGLGAGGGVETGHQEGAGDPAPGTPGGDPHLALAGLLQGAEVRAGGQPDEHHQAEGGDARGVEGVPGISGPGELAATEAVTLPPVVVPAPTVVQGYAPALLAEPTQHLTASDASRLEQFAAQAKPATFASNTPFGQALAQEYRETVLWHAANAPRSLQRTLGPSEIGHACDRQIIGKLVGTPRTNNVVDQWASIMGTAGHGWMDETFTKENERQGYQRFLTERKVDPYGDGQYRGSADLYDAAHQAVVDWKFLGESSMAQVRSAEGPPIHYQRQLKLYGRGYRLLGLPVRRVVLVAWPRTSSSSDGVYVWDHELTPEDDQELDWLWHHMEWRKTWAAAIDAGNATLMQAPASPSSEECYFCPFWRPQAVDGGPGCPGTADPSRSG